jgi:hypothetical protein
MSITYRRKYGSKTARQRIQVALPQDVLQKFLLDARANMRSASSLAAAIIVKHYQQQEQTS